MAAKKSKKNKSKQGLPAKVMARLTPYIERGIQRGLWDDEAFVVNLFNEKLKEDSIKQTVDDMGGKNSAIALQFVADAVLVDLTDILRKRPYEVDVQVWEVSSTVIASTGRPACFMFGQCVVKDKDGELEPAMFTLSLWDDMAELGDDVERDGSYTIQATCTDLESDVLFLSPLKGMTQFNKSKRKHGDRLDLLRETWEVSTIAELPDNLSRSNYDYRLIEATVVSAMVQPKKSGGTLGRMVIRDDSALDALDGDDDVPLNLSALCDPDIALRFGKYSKVLVLLTVSDNPQYGLTANIKAAEGIHVVQPAHRDETPDGDDSDDNAATYFAKTTDTDEDEWDDDDDDDTDADEESPDDTDDDDDAEEAPEETEATTDDDDDDDWVDEDDDEEEEEAEEEAPAETESEDDDDDDWDDEDWE